MGMIRTAVHCAILAVAFGGGCWYGGRATERCGYSIINKGGQCYVQEKRTGNQEPLHSGLQLGSIRHRVEGLFNERDDNFGELEAAVYSVAREQDSVGEPKGYRQLQYDVNEK